MTKIKKEVLKPTAKKKKVVRKKPVQKELVTVQNKDLLMKLVYDVSSCPKELGVANMIKVAEQHRIIFWNSELGVKPAFYGFDGVEAQLLIVDTKGQEIDFEQYEREFNQKVFWDKELYNCHHSPTYYWDNYGTPVFPATVDGSREYLISIGLKDLPAMTDSTKAKKAWEKQKDKVNSVMSKITVEHLKERKNAIDVLRAEYVEKVKALESLVRDEVNLFDAKGEPYPAKKRISMLVGKIKTFSIVPEKWMQYRNKKRKWDGAMLYNTNYDILLEIYNDIRPDTIKSHAKVLDLNAK